MGSVSDAWTGCIDRKEAHINLIQKMLWDLVTLKSPFERPRLVVPRLDEILEIVDVALVSIIWLCSSQARF